MSRPDETTLERGAPAGTPTNPDRLGLVLRSAYHEDLVNELKTLPVGDRHWDPEREAWWIAPRHEDFVVAAAIQAFGCIKVIGLEGESDYYIDRHGRAVQERLL